ncbi:MAG: site-2 protease family protein [Candidatus Aenigmatarchaeota archaeon]
MDLLYPASVLVFVCILAILVYRDRKNFKRESIFLLRRMTFGRGTLVFLGKRFPRFWKFLGFFSVLTGFLVSILGVNMLIDTLISSIATKSSTPSLALLLPSPTAEPIFGFGFLAVPFWYWIICIALLALVHEGLHGIYAAREGAKIKSLGFGILAVIPLAFVEPDEKQLAKKGVWPQLRVFSAGSFANFLLAALSVFIMVLMVQSVYVPAGVDFQTYPSSAISVASIVSLDGTPVSGQDSFIAAIAGFGENDTIEIMTSNGTFYLKNKLLGEQLSAGAKENILAFKDYPAARAGLEGTIKFVNGREIKDPADLSAALEDAGAGAAIEVQVQNGDALQNFTLVTSELPAGTAFSPDTGLIFFASLEQTAPGSIDFYIGAGEFLYGMSGGNMTASYSYLTAKQNLWAWVGENYPALGERASARALALQEQLDAKQEPGFIGILGVLTHSALAPGLTAFAGVFIFIEGFLAFLFIINLGVGIVNLLPLKPLDGGKMWDIVLRRYIPKRAGLVMKILAYFILALLLANFIPFGMLLS